MSEEIRHLKDLLTYGDSIVEDGEESLSAYTERCIRIVLAKNERLNKTLEIAVDTNERQEHRIEELQDGIKEVREMRKYLSNKYYEMGEEVDMGVIIEHLDRILDKVEEK